MMTTAELQHEAMRLALLLERAADSEHAAIPEWQRRSTQRKAAALLRIMADTPLVQDPEPNDDALYHRWVGRPGDRRDLMRDQVIAYARDLLTHHGVITSHL